MRNWLTVLGFLVWTSPSVMAQMGRIPDGWMPPGTPISSTTRSTSNPPRITFARPAYDFGDVDEGAPVTHLYRFRNTGRGPLRIGDIHASCGCMAAAAARREVPPGGTGTIRAVYHTQGRPGRTMKNITVDTNDPKAPSFSLSFTVNVVRDIDVQPDRVYFFGVKQGQGRAITLTALGKPGRRLKIRNVSTRDHRVRVTSAPLTQAGTTPTAPGRYGITLVVEMPGDASIGEISDEIVLLTDHPRKPEVRIPVNGEVVGRIQAFPKTVFMGDLGQPQTVNLYVDPPDGFAIRNVSTEKGLVKPWVRALPRPGGQKQYNLVVSGPNPGRLAPGEFNDVIVLKTNEPKQREVRVGVKGNKPGP